MYIFEPWCKLVAAIISTPVTRASRMFSPLSQASSQCGLRAGIPASNSTGSVTEGTLLCRQTSVCLAGINFPPFLKEDSWGLGSIQEAKPEKGRRLRCNSRRLSPQRSHQHLATNSRSGLSLRRLPSQFNERIPVSRGHPKHLPQAQQQPPSQR